MSGPATSEGCGHPVSSRQLHMQQRRRRRSQTDTPSSLSSTTMLLHVFSVWGLLFFVHLGSAAAIATTAIEYSGVNNALPINEAERPSSLEEAKSLSTSSRRATNGPEDDVCQPRSPSYDALACFLLRKLRIGPLPPQTFKSGIFHLSLRDLECSNVTVSNLTANATTTNASREAGRFATDNANSSPTSTVEIQVAALGAVCTATYETMGLGGTLVATVGQQQDGRQMHLDPLRVADNAERTEASARKYDERNTDDYGDDALSWTVRVNSTTHNKLSTAMPDAVATSGCSTDLQVVDLAFGGSITSRLVNLFRGQIAAYVTAQVNQNVCPALVAQVDPYVTEEVRLLESYLDPYLLKDIVDPIPEDGDGDRPASAIDANKRKRAASFASGADTDANDDTVDASDDLPSFSGALRWINRALWDDHLQGGFLRHWFPNVTTDQNQHRCGGSFDGWNGILSSLLPPPDEALVVPIPAPWRTIEFDVNGDTHAQIHLGDSLELHGMAHWTAFQLLRPSSLDSSSASAKPSGLVWNSVLASSLDELQQPPMPLGLGMHLTINISSLGPPCNHQATETPGTDSMLDRVPKLSTVTSRVRFPACESLVEHVHVKVNASDVLVRADLELDGRRSHFREIQLDTVFQALAGIVDTSGATDRRLSDDPSGKAARCLLHGVDRVAVTNLYSRLRIDGVRLTRPPASTSVGAAKTTLGFIVEAGSSDDDGGGDDYSIQEDLERDIDRLLNEIVNHVVLSEYSEYVTAAILGLSHGPLPDVLNQALQRWLDAQHAQHDQEDPEEMCKVPDEDLRFPQWVNFSDVYVLHQLNGWLEQPDVVQTVNDYLNCVVDFLVAALREQFRSVEWPTNSSPSGTGSSLLHIELHHLDILNAGSLQTIRVVRPERNGMYLSTGLTYGTNTTFDNLPQLHLELNVTYPPLNFSAQFQVSILVNDVNLGLGVILHYNLNALKSMLLQAVARHAECWVAPTSDWVWVDPEGRLGFIAVSINATARALSMDQPLLVTIDSQRSSSIREFCINAVFRSIETIRDVLSSWTGALQSRATRHCGAASDDGDDYGDPPPHFTSLLVIMAAILLLAQPAVALIQWRPSTSYENADDGLSDRFDLARPLLQQTNESNLDEAYDDSPEAWDEPEQREWADKTSLMDRQTPALAFSVPVALLTSFVLILCSHLSTVASVDVSLLLDGRSLSFPSVLDIDPSRAVGEFGHVGPNLLIIAVGLASGIWPYARLVLLLHSWMSSSLSSSRRARLLRVLESLGKYAFAEVYVVILAIVLFRYHLSVDANHAFDVFVAPKLGLFGFWVGSMTSLFLGHAIVSCHHGSVLRHRASAQWRRGSSVLTHEFTVRESASGPSRRQLSRTFYGVLVAWLAASIVLLWLGVTRDAFSMRAGGWAGTAVPHELGADRRSYSLLALARLVPSSFASSKSAGALGLASFVWATVFVMPAVCLALLTALLVTPCSVDRQLRLLSWSEVARSWSAIEVGTGSILLTVLGLPSLVNRAVQDRCDAWLQDVTYGSSGEEASCFHLDMNLESGMTLLIIGAMLHTSLVAVCLRLSRQAVDERIARCGRGDGEQQRLLSDSPASSLLRRVSRSPWMARCVLAPPHDRYRLVADPDSSEAGPPLQGDANNISSNVVEPWQATASFEAEWQDAAERDPEWKEWKEWKDATNVT